MSTVHRTVRAVTAMTVGLVLLAGPAWAGTPASGFDDQAYVSGLAQPTAIAFLPDGRLLVTEKGGALRLAHDGTATTLLDVPVCTASEMGLLGIAVDPGFAMNGLVYLYRTAGGVAGCGSATDRFNQVVRVTVGATTADPSSLMVLLSGIRTDNGNHDGGGLRIGPDGALYVGVGDTGLGDNQGGPGSATNPYAQDLGSLNGKLLRLALDGTAPPDNPFVGLAGARPEIFAYGFRNPFRFGFDPLLGRLWVGDVGDLTIEEIDVVHAGGNYGWPACEGLLPLGCAPAAVAPVLTYPHGGAGVEGECVIGGAFAEGGVFAALRGDYFFADFGENALTEGTIYHAVPTAARDGLAAPPVPIVTEAAGPVDLIFGPDGALYYIAIRSGEIRRVAPALATTTTIIGTGPTTTTVPSDCTAVRPGFVGVRCRLIGVVTAVNVLGDLGALELGNPLRRASMLLDQAETAVGQGRSGQARGWLGAAQTNVTVFRRRVRSAAGRRTLEPIIRRGLLDTAREVVTALRSLRRSI